MYSNIGSKIKTLAVIFCIFGMIGSILGGISFMAMATFGFRHVEGWEILIGIIIMVVGCLVSWISQFLLYGFGEIITKLRDIEHHFYEQGRYAGGRIAPAADAAPSYAAPAYAYNHAPAPAPTYQRPYNPAPAQPMNNVPVNNARPMNAPMNDANTYINRPAQAPMNNNMPMNNMPMNAQPAPAAPAQQPVAPAQPVAPTQQPVAPTQPIAPAQPTAPAEPVVHAENGVENNI